MAYHYGQQGVPAQPLALTTLAPMTASFTPFLHHTAHNLHPLPVPTLKILARAIEIKPMPKTKPLLVDGICAWIEDWLSEDRDEVGLWNGLRMLGKRKFD